MMIKNSTNQYHFKVDYIRKVLGIEFPKSFLNPYVKDVKEGRDTFIQDVYDIALKGSMPEITVLIAEEFAAAIALFVQNTIEQEGLEAVFNQIKRHSFNGIKAEMIGENVLFIPGKQEYEETSVFLFVYEEILYAVNDYDLKKGVFNFHLIQQAFEYLESNTNLIQCVIEFHVDCGGASGFIVKGKEAGSSISYYHGAYDKDLEWNGISIEYQGFLDE